MPEAPAMLGGYMTTLLVALLPPLWHRCMIPRLLQWDAQYADPTERELARQANLRSGLRELERAAQVE
jgi:alkane 1-monooxygenase